MPVVGTTTPLEFSVSGLSLLLRGWRGLSPTEQQLRARALIEEQRAAGRLPLFPELPGWDDIIKLGPLQARRTLQDEKRRRQRTAIRIVTAPTPPEVQALGAIVNAIDDVEDIVSFTSLIGRLVIRAAPRLAAQLTPGLGRLVTISDVLNVLTLLVSGAAIATGVSLAGPTAAATNVIGVQATKALLKHEMWELLRLGTRKRIRTQPLSEIVEKLLRRGQALEALQATETLFGVGISLGAAVGFIQDLGWNLHKAAFGPLPRDRQRFGQQLTTQLPPEFVLLERRPMTNIPCLTATGITANATKWPAEAYALLTAKRPTISPARQTIGPVC